MLEESFEFTDMGALEGLVTVAGHPTPQHERIGHTIPVHTTHPSIIYVFGVVKTGSFFNQFQANGPPGSRNRDKSGNGRADAERRRRRGVSASRETKRAKGAEDSESRQRNSPGATVRAREPNHVVDVVESDTPDVSFRSLDGAAHQPPRHGKRQVA